MVTSNHCSNYFLRTATQLHVLSSASSSDFSTSIPSVLSEVGSVICRPVIWSSSDVSRPSTKQQQRRQNIDRSSRTRHILQQPTQEGLHCETNCLVQSYVNMTFSGAAAVATVNRSGVTANLLAHSSRESSGFPSGNRLISSAFTSLSVA